MNNVIDGKKIAQDLKDRIAKEVKTFDRPPGLGAILVGEDPASHIYVRNKELACIEAGFYSEKIKKPTNITEEELLNEVGRMNEDQKIDGILVQLPLPDHIDSNKVLEHISPMKDVDGFCSENIGKLAQNKPSLRPCTPKGVITMLESIGVDLKGKDCVVIGASNIVGRPMAIELLNKGSTVTICNSKTKDIAAKTIQADIIVVGVGVPKLVKSNWVKDSAIVIDVGINRMEDGTLCGDVDYDALKDKVFAITPVPGGVGPMTIAILLENTLDAYKAKL